MQTQDNLGASAALSVPVSLSLLPQPPWPQLIDCLGMDEVSHIWTLGTSSGTSLAYCLGTGLEIFSQLAPQVWSKLEPARILKKLSHELSAALATMGV